MRRRSWKSLSGTPVARRAVAHALPTVLNDEATLMILDEHIGEQMNQIFFEDLADAEEITLEKFRHRPWFDRVEESAAMLLARVL